LETRQPRRELPVPRAFPAESTSVDTITGTYYFPYFPVDRDPGDKAAKAARDRDTHVGLAPISAVPRD